MKSFDYRPENNRLQPDTLYATTLGWPATQVRKTYRLSDRSQGWSVFTPEGLVVSKTLAFESVSTMQHSASARENLVLPLEQAKTIALTYNDALTLLAHKEFSHEIDDILFRLNTAGFSVSQKGSPCGHTYSLKQLLKDYGMFVRFFQALVSHLPVICPDAAVVYDLDDEDNFPTLCNVQIRVRADMVDRVQSEVIDGLREYLDPLFFCAVEIGRNSGMIDFTVTVQKN